MLDELKTAQKIVGARQLLKAIRKGDVRKVLLAKDADPWITEPVRLLAEEYGVETLWVETTSELGTACGIAVGASAAGIRIDEA